MVIIIKSLIPICDTEKTLTYYVASLDEEVGGWRIRPSENLRNLAVKISSV